jgi:hypothetical protein
MRKELEFVEDSKSIADVASGEIIVLDNTSLATVGGGIQEDLPGPLKLQEDLPGPSK